jgi:hypothetical protein
LPRGGTYAHPSGIDCQEGWDQFPPSMGEPLLPDEYMAGCASISQAEDRQWRIGQVNPVVATTLISKETLDVSIRAVQRRKAELLNVVVPGGDSNVADADARLNAGGGVYEEIPEDELEEGLPKNEFEIVERIVKEVVAMHAHHRAAGKKAA